MLSCIIGIGGFVPRFICNGRSEDGMFGPLGRGHQQHDESRHPVCIHSVIIVIGAKFHWLDSLDHDEIQIKRTSYCQEAAFGVLHDPILTHHMEWLVCGRESPKVVMHPIDK